MWCVCVRACVRACMHAWVCVCVCRSRVFASSSIDGRISDWLQRSSDWFSWTTFTTLNMLHRFENCRVQSLISVIIPCVDANHAVTRRSEPKSVRYSQWGWQRSRPGWCSSHHWTKPCPPARCRKWSLPDQASHHLEPSKHTIAMLTRRRQDQKQFPCHYMLLLFLLLCVC